MTSGGLTLHEDGQLSYGGDVVSADEYIRARVREARDRAKAEAVSVVERTLLDGPRVPPETLTKLGRCNMCGSPDGTQRSVMGFGQCASVWHEDKPPRRARGHGGIEE